MVHRPGAPLARRQGPEHDPRRRRRRHDARAQGHRVRSARFGPRAPRVQLRRVERRARPAGQVGRVGADPLDRGRQGHPRRDRGDHHRCAPPLPDVRGRPAPVPGDQRQRLGDQVEVRQPLRLPSLPHRRHQPCDRRDDRRQGRGRLRLRRRRQGMCGVAQGSGCPGDRHRDRPDLRAAGGDGGLPGHHARGRARDGRHLHHDHGQQGHHQLRAHGAHEAPGHRRATSATSTTRSTWPASAA